MNFDELMYTFDLLHGTLHLTRFLPPSGTDGLVLVSNNVTIIGGSTELSPASP